MPAPEDFGDAETVVQRIESARSFEIRPRRLLPKGTGKVRYTYELMEGGSTLSEWPDEESAKEEARDIAQGAPARVTVLRV